MRKIYIEDTSPINIGKQGENLATQIVFPIKKWFGDVNPEGSFTVVSIRPGEVIGNPKATSHDAKNVYWVVDSSELITAGNGVCQVVYVYEDDEETVSKTVTFTTVVSESLEQGENPPEPYEDWITALLRQVNQAKASAEAAALSAQQSALSAQQYATDTVKYTEQPDESSQRRRMARYNLGFGEDGVLGIPEGGTGADNAYDARRFLGFTNGIVPVALGGTGSSNASAARQALGALGTNDNAKGLTAVEHSSELTPYQDRCYISGGGYYELGEFVFVQLRMVINAYQTTGEKYWSMITGFPAVEGADYVPLLATFRNDSGMSRTGDQEVGHQVAAKLGSSGALWVWLDPSLRTSQRAITISGLYKRRD